jgi:hypothetical protein
MTSRTSVLLAVLVGGSLFTATGCASGGNPPSPPATVQQVCYPGEAPPTCYFNVVLDFTSSSHREVGRQYALAILRAKPDYEATIDYLLALHVYLVQLAPPNLTFADVLARAQVLHANPSFPAEYRDEIAGMQEVFDYDVDELGDGRLSRNELLVFQFLSEVVRPSSCSVSAVTGSVSATGKTLFGRNWDWLSVTAWGTGSVHAMTTFRNGGKTIANFGSLGLLFALTVFNQHHLAGAIVNSTTGADYPSPESLATRRSFFFDLRYAFENYSTLAEIADFLKAEDHRYVYNHLMFLADPTTAGVVENQVNSREGPGQGNRAFRTDGSTLNPQLPPEQTWGILDAFVTVNDFRLPGNDWRSEEMTNTTRWESFRKLYAGVPSGQRIDIDTLKATTGYPGPSGDGVMSNGAIFNSELQKVVVPPGGKLEPAETTMQSILMDMGTMELWVHFVPPVAPWTKPPLQPTYRKIANPIY